jgi:hypothetical protein
MTQVRDFVAGLARAGKSASEIKKLVDDADGDKALGLTSIYYILKRVKAGKSTEDQRKFSAKKPRGLPPLSPLWPPTLLKTAVFPSRISPPSMVSPLGLCSTFYAMV